MKHALIFNTVLFLFVSLTVFAQNPHAYERAGDQALSNKDFGNAANYYNIALQRNEHDIDVNWKYADAARYYSAYMEAEATYKRITTLPSYQKEYPLTDYYLGEVQTSQGKYADAILHYERFITSKPKADKIYFEEARRRVENLRMAQTMVNEPPKMDVTITHLGKEVNSPYSEFAPSVVGDTLFYSSYRFQQKGKKKDPFAKISKVLISSKGGKGYEPGRGFPVTDTAHVAHTAFSPDGHYVIFTVCQNDNASDINCELWLTVIDRRNRWLPPVKLPEPINLPGFTSTQPAIGYDKSVSGPVLFFSSDRPGGKGELDIWSVPLDTNFFCECNLPLPGKKIGKLPKFKKPANLTALNTPQNDGTPFFHAPSQELYFSSEGHNGLGGWDVFSTKKVDNQYLEPINMGEGVNTSYNDLYFYLKEDGSNGYISSNRPGSFLLDEDIQACCNDIFSVKINSREERTVIQPTPPSEEVLIPTATAEIKQASKGVSTQVEEAPKPMPSLTEFIGLRLFFDNDEPDKRTRKTTTGMTYEESVRAYLGRQDEYRDRFSGGLYGASLAEAENNIDAFFENEVRTGFNRLNQLSDVIYEKLKQGEKIEIVIKGFTSPRAKSDYNLNLSKRRISSVVNHFMAYNDGVLMPYIESRKFIMSEASFGETNARTNVSDLLKDERNSIYNPDAARERKVEIIDINSIKG